MGMKNMGHMNQECFGDGFRLFMRFADGCRCYLKDKGILAEEDNRAILDYFRTGKKPSKGVIRRVYYVAFPGLESTSRRLGKGVFDPDAVREFFAFDHNREKVRQENYVCIAFPARVIERKGGKVFVELSPVRGSFWIDSDVSLEPGEWAMVHRMNIVEKITGEYAKRVSDNLKNLGMKNEMKFPRVAIRYLKKLKESDGSGGSRVLGEAR